MAFVAINVLEVPPQMRATLEERFAGRAGEVEKMEGFQSFELLRPVPSDLENASDDQGLDRYFVYTRWDSRESFEAWVSSQAFSRGHAQHAAGGPAATGSQVWTFEVVQATGAREPADS